MNKLIEHRAFERLATLGALAIAALLGACAHTSAPIVADASAAVSPILGPYQHIPAPRWREPDPAKTVKRTGTALQVENLYREGQYGAVAREAQPLLEPGKADDELRLYIANSLAWTGRLEQAVEVYKTLADGEQGTGANIGIANIRRWQGQPHLSIPLYKSVLAKHPKDEAALEGLKLSMREVRPRTTVRAAASRDSSDVNSRQLLVNHRWRDKSLTNVWEVEELAYRVYDPTDRANGNDLTVRYRSLDKPLKPRLEVSTDGHTAFASAGIEFEAVPLKLDLGRINWGRISNNPRGLSAGLTAERANAQLNLSTDFGALFVNAEHLRISDGNIVNASTVRFTPSLQPFGKRLKLFAGIETRDARFNTLRYWSPSDGYGSANIGMTGEWGGPDWEFGVAGQVGRRLYGEAGKSWATTVSGKRWITDDWALGMNAWAMSNRRDQQQYRARSVFVTLEKLWD